MTENMKKLLEAASTNEDLKNKLNGSAKETIIALAKAQDIELSDADFVPQKAELSEDELESVAGGKKCFCIWGGGGTGEACKGNKTCACVVVGSGFTMSGRQRCYCPAVGDGNEA